MVGPSRQRDIGRSHLSGSSKRKAKDEKEKKEKEVLAKTSKLNNYFGASGNPLKEKMNLLKFLSLPSLLSKMITMKIQKKILKMQMAILKLQMKIP